MESPTPTGKAALRALARQRRAALPADLRAGYSAAIAARVGGSAAFAAAACVLAFSSIGDEVDTAALLGAVRTQGKTLLLPRVERSSGELVLHAVADPARDLCSGPWGIQEPDPRRCAVADIALADLVLVPGVAFAVDGSRIGYGKGYYDRLLTAARADAVVMGLAFETQLFPALPLEAHDLPMQWLATEQRLIDCRGPV